MKHHIIWFYLFMVNYVSNVGGNAHVFWIDLQKSGNGSSSDTYWNCSNIQQQQSNIPNSILSLVVQPNQRLAFNATNPTALTPFAMNIPDVFDGFLCEQVANPCPCAWFKAGSKCYFWRQFYTAQTFSWPQPSNICPGGKLAQDYKNIDSNWQIIQQYHPLDCGQGYFRPSDPSVNKLCLSYPTSQTSNWHDAETTCLPTAHILTFSSQIQADAILNQYKTMQNINNCNYGKMWLGYNKYAYNGQKYAGTNYKDADSTVIANVDTAKSTGDCVQYDPSGSGNGTWSSVDCTATDATYICLQDFPRWGQCNQGWRYIVPYCYIFLNDTYSYANGIAQCKLSDPNSNLASFHSTGQWDDVNSYRIGFVNLKQYGQALENIYVGYQSQSSANWQYVDNSDPSYANWESSGVPASNGATQCAISTLAKNYSWSAENDCTATHGVLCMGTVTNPCADPTYMNIDGQCYKYLTTPATTWDQAAIQCNAQGGTLPLIGQSMTGGGQGDQWNVFQRWRTGLKPSDNIWIGLTQLTNYFQPLLWMNRVWYNPAIDNQIWSAANPDSVNPYVASTKNHNYRWTTENDTFQANVICHLKKNPISCGSNFYQVQFGTNYYCYMPNITPMTFGDGEMLCRSQNVSAHLLDYQNNADWANYKALHYMFLAMKYPVSTFWVGYSRGPSNLAGPWVANHFGISDVFGNSSMWAGGEPNGVVTDSDRYCISGVINSNGSWYDNLCNMTFGVVCEADTLNTFCPEGWGEFYGTDIITCYQVPSSPPLDMASANSYCKNITGNSANLSSFHSLAEWQDFQRFRWTLINTNRANFADDIWTGLTDYDILLNQKNTLNYKWLDGSNYNWSNWQPHVEPANFSWSGIASTIYSPSNIDNMYWYTHNKNLNLSFICQMRQTVLTNPCSGNFSSVGGRCLKPITWGASAYTRTAAQLACQQTLNYTLPSFSSQSSWLSFVSWLYEFIEVFFSTNMNNAKQFSYPNQSTWPMQSFWIGLTLNPTFIWDDLSVYQYNNTDVNHFTQMASNFYANSTINLIWTQTSTTTNAGFTTPTLICQDQVPSRTMCNGNGYFLSKIIPDVCYKTVLQAPMNYTSASSICAPLTNSYLPSFHNANEWKDFVSELQDAALFQGLDTTNGVWIGLNDVQHSFVWQWENHMTYNWTNWIPYVEPNSDVTLQCVGAVQISNNNWQWMRRSCSDNLAVMCQYRNQTPAGCSLSGYSNIGGDCYQIVPPIAVNSINFEQALFYCQSLNGTLPCFNSNSDWDDFVNWENNFATSANLNATDFWLGYQSTETFPSWSCIDQSTPSASFIPWESGMPVETGQSYCAASLVESSYNSSNHYCTTTAMNSLICKQSNKISLCPDSTWLPIGNDTNQICYKTITQNKGIRSNAVTSCNNVGSTLPNFHSFQEYDDFNRLYLWYSQVKYNLDSSSGVWIGLTDKNIPFQWEWDDQSSYNWNYWDINAEPSAVTSNQCVVSIVNVTGQYIWRRASCNANAAVICQVRVPIVTPSICAPGWSEIDGHCFRLWPGIKNLNAGQMETFCNLNGGRLPSFLSDVTWQQFLDWKQNTGRGRNYQSSSFWLYCCTGSNPWEWNNNFPGGFGNWTITPIVTAPFCSAAIANQSYSWNSVDCDSTFIDSAICMIFSNPPAPCPSPWVGLDVRRCFLQLNTSAISYVDAVAQCQLENGGGVSSLPSFHNNKIWPFFNSVRWYFAAQTNLNPISSPVVWIGATDQSNELLYQNTDQSNFNWAAWKSGVEPMNNTNKNCVVAPSLNDSNGNWTTDACSSKNVPICMRRSNKGHDACGIPGWSRVANRCYRIIPLTQRINFQDANNTCNKLNATLPSFDNSTQWDSFSSWRANFANAKYLNTTDFWLGAQINNDTGQFEWTDYVVTSFGDWTNWYAGEPGNFQCIGTKSDGSAWATKHCYVVTLPSLICQLIQYPVDCQMTDWVNSSCSQTCGNATLQSNRSITQINLNNGSECSNDTFEIHDCLDQIPCPIDCKDEYTEWGECDCGASDDGIQYRKRTLLIQDQYNGIPCPLVVESQICPALSCWPMSDAEKIAAQVLQTFGCVWLLSICGMTFVLCIFFRIFSLERMFHAGQELCIVLTHFLVLFLRTDVKHKTVCTVASALIQFGTIGSFTFMLMEAVQAYCYATNVISNKNFLSWKLNLLCALLPPTVITLGSSVPFHHDYPAKFSCWLNIGNKISAATVLPVIVCSLAVIVILESAGMHDAPHLPDTNKKKYTFNKFNQRGLLFILPLNTAAWAVGMFAIYYQNIAMFSLVFGVFIALGVSILMFHCLCHAVIYLLFSTLLARLFPCCIDKPNPNLQSHGVDGVHTKSHAVKGSSPNPDGGAAKIANEKSENINNVGSDESKNKQSKEPDFFKDPEAWKLWVLDGRLDNMNQSENLLF